MYWIELSLDAELVRRNQVADLLAEADEILSIAVSSIKTAGGAR